MGSKNKLKRFNQNLSFSNVIQPEREEVTSGEFRFKGKWRQDFFKNDRPIVVELGCGKGEYSVYLAQKYPEKNFVGVDIKGARFWAGAKESLELGLSNVGFLRTQIELIDAIFEENEVDEIWITFPDPQIKFKRTKHRLTNPAFLDRYHTILKPEGQIHLKTDSEFLHGYTLGLLEGKGWEVDYAHHNVYGNPYSPKHVTAIQTHYERLFMEKGRLITYLSFRFPNG
ncbi:MAG: tRNA (guanosine(46)-N7)-methyltransferase TrmB [Flavobacteriaceae bacterium]|nr:tRNA (guanosine(46)-N7)-methyltransferase TrmB [Flavobacteriaceae bacterium]